MYLITDQQVFDKCREANLNPNLRYPRSFIAVVRSGNALFYANASSSSWPVVVIDVAAALEWGGVAGSTN